MFLGVLVTGLGVVDEVDPSVMVGAELATTAGLGMVMFLNIQYGAITRAPSTVISILSNYIINIFFC